MPHYSRIDKIVIDVAPADHSKEVEFWSAATGQRLRQTGRFPEYHWGDIPGQDVGLLIQRMEAGTSRVHVDIRTTDVDAEVTRLEQLGATRIRMVHDWWVLEDPAGLPFCVIPDNPENLSDDNAQRWG